MKNYTNSLKSENHIHFITKPVIRIVIILTIFVLVLSAGKIQAQPFMVGVHGDKIQTYNSQNYNEVSAEFSLTLPGLMVIEGMAITYNNDNYLHYAIVLTEPLFLYPDYHLVTVDPTTGICSDITTLGNVRNSSFKSITYSSTDSSLYFMFEASAPEFQYRFMTLRKFNVNTSVITTCKVFQGQSFNRYINPSISFNKDDGFIYNLFVFVDELAGMAPVVLQKIDLTTYNATPVNLSGDTLTDSNGGLMYLGLGSFAVTNGSTGYKMTSNGFIEYVAGLSYPVLRGFGLADTPLPVELTSFTSSVNGSTATLYWSTSSETNNSVFEIEKNINGSWVKAGSAAGHGTSTVHNNYSFTDRNLNTGKYNYRLKQIDFNGNFEYFNLINEVVIGIPDNFDLSQNYPNPFNPSTKINFELPADSKVSIELYDISGKEVTKILNEFKTAGYYTVNFNASNLSSGTYFYKITLEVNGQKFTATKKMLLLK